MRRFLLILFCTALFLSACSPTVILLDPALAVTPTLPAKPLPLPKAHTPVPSPTPGYDLGIAPQDLKGVEVLVWHGWDGTSASLLAQMAGEYNLTNKWKIRVLVESQLNLSLLNSAVKNVLGRPEQPDLVVALPEHILAWQPQVLELTPYETQKVIGLEPGLIPAGFIDQSRQGEDQYGLPAARSARFIFYNASFAHDLGFEAAPRTTEEFRKQACAANAFWKQDDDQTNDGFGGLVLDVIDAANWQTPFSWLAAGGGQVFSDGKYQFNTPENINALGFLTQLRDADCAWLSDSDTNFEHLATRRALFITGGLGDISAQTAAFSAIASPDKWTLLPFPGNQAGIVPYGPDYAILKSTPERQLAAWLFLRWLLEPQNQIRWSRGTGLLPVTQPVLKMLATDFTLKPQWGAALELIPQSRIYPQTSTWSLVNKILADGMLAYNRSYPNVPLENILKMMDGTIHDLVQK